jgi:hypothetical protein
LSGYGFSLDDDTSDVGAYASNFTPHFDRVEPNHLEVVFSGLGDLPNQKKWYANVQWGDVTDNGTISNPTDGPNKDRTIVTLTDPTKYWQIQPPGPDLVGAFVSSSDGSIPAGTVVTHQDFANGLVLWLSARVPNSGTVQLTFSGGRPANPILNAGFEDPFLTQAPPANQAANILNNKWTFAKNSGIAGNGSSYSNLNGPAPEGKQVGFLLGSQQSTISQQVTLQAGTYILSFYGVQRQRKTLTDKQTINVFVDNDKKAAITPSGPNYTPYTVEFIVTAGTHTIKFGGGASDSGMMAFIDNLSLSIKPATTAVVTQALGGQRARPISSTSSATDDAALWAVLNADRKGKKGASLFQ